jgi:hypothetical protein
MDGGWLISSAEVLETSALMVPIGSTILRQMTDSKTLHSAGGFRSPKVFLEVAVFGEDIGQRLVHDLIGGDVEKGCVLVNLRGGGYVKANCRVDVAGLNDLKQRHF